MESFVKYCKDYITENLPDYEGQNIYLCDLGFAVTEGPNYDGTLTYSSKEASDYLSKWAYEASDYFQYEVDNFGKARNPFENPEAYMVCMVIEGCRSLIDSAISKIPKLNSLWNSNVELTSDMIKMIIEEVNGDSRTELF